MEQELIKITEILNLKDLSEAIFVEDSIVSIKYLSKTEVIDKYKNQLTEKQILDSRTTNLK